jgi:DNA-nicking Smr family endonuclease
VTATIRPLSRVPIKPAEGGDEVPAAPAGKSRILMKAAAPVRARPAPPAPPVRPGVTLDGSWDRKLSRGQVVPDRTLDLHGQSLDGAWTAIDRALDRAIGDGVRVLLLVTGHAPKGQPPIERGKIRAAVHDWLAVSRHAAHIAAVRSAHPRHGGGGSLYVILRRA